MFVLGALLISSSAVAYSIDEYGRNIWSHDNIYGGHTTSRHIGKSFSYLRGRCNGRKINKFFSTYPSTATAEGTLYKMINANRFNREQINQFQYMKGQGVRSEISGTIYRAYRRWWSWRTKYRTAYGQGIDCSRLNEVVKKRHWFWTYYKKMDEYNYLTKAKAILRFNTAYDTWYILTSYPKR